MDTVSVLTPDNMGKNFIPKEFLPAGKDEYYLRNTQISSAGKKWRNLRSDEVESLVKNNNTAASWDQILVSDEFEPNLIRDCDFFGLVRIGRLRKIVLEHHDLHMPAGIYDSKVIACDIGDDAAIHNVRYMAHYIIGDRCILANIDEMHTTDHAKFGNGIIKDGEPEKVRVKLEVMNETGCRSVYPFDGMITADAYLWAKYRDDSALQKKLAEITQNSFDSRRGYYGTIGDQCVIKNCQILKDVKIGAHSYIKGANKLKNLTINSSADEPVQIGEGVELVNGIVGYGCHIFYGSKAVRFILGRNSNLKYGARLIHSFLGDNSTISCCEVLNNLIFPAHEQHHNNSFLIASVVMGQSNMAAGATVGSNHNSRANDNEVQAGRGFWPGLCVSVKHSSKFASFTLLSKGAYPAELNIPLPFSLLNDNTSKDQLEVMPAFWWLYNMFALARNSWKFQTRDQRKVKVQNIEFDALAPDTAEELFEGRRLLEIWTAKARLKAQNKTDKSSADTLAKNGRELLTSNPQEVKKLEVLGENMEKSSRKAVIIKPAEAYKAYGDMLVYYAIKNLLNYFNARPNADFESMCDELKGPRQNKWVNIGGQLMPEKDLDKLRTDIGSGSLNSWQQIHDRYNKLWSEYKLQKQKHSFATLCDFAETSKLTKARWFVLLDKAVTIQQYVSDQVYQSRKKDYDNPFRQATFRNNEEMLAAIGTIDDNSFIKQVRDETDDFKRMAEGVKKRS